jgi:hypothetical protein
MTPTLLRRLANHGFLQRRHQSGGTAEFRASCPRTQHRLLCDATAEVRELGAQRFTRMTEQSVILRAKVRRQRGFVTGLEGRELRGVEGLQLVGHRSFLSIDMGAPRHA